MQGAAGAPCHGYHDRSGMNPVTAMVGYRLIGHHCHLKNEHTLQGLRNLVLMGFNRIDLPGSRVKNLKRDPDRAVLCCTIRSNVHNIESAAKLSTRRE